jgi:hypothetical protein
MHCPQCGQQQTSEVVRFCSRCGFPLDGVIHLLTNNGILPTYQPVPGTKEISPRRKGVRQGGILLLTGVLLVPILGVLASFAGNSNFLEMLVAIAAILCFVGGPLRMLYAGLFEEGAPTLPRVVATPYVQPVPLRPGVPPRGALPPPPVHQAPGWSPRPQTGELVRPPSVTEGTTRLLDKDDPSHH